MEFNIETTVTARAKTLLTGDQIKGIVQQALTGARRDPAWAEGKSFELPFTTPTGVHMLIALDWRKDGYFAGIGLPDEIQHVKPPKRGKSKRK